MCSNRIFTKTTLNMMNVILKPTIISNQYYDYKIYIYLGKLKVIQLKDHVLLLSGQ